LVYGKAKHEPEFTSASDRANAIRGATPPSRPIATLDIIKKER